MRVLFISNLYPPHFLGGYELLCEEVCRGFVARGHAATVLTSTHGAAGDGDVAGSRVLRRLRLTVPFERAYCYAPLNEHRAARENAAATRALLAAERFDAVFLWSQLRLSLGPARAVDGAGLPAVWTFNDANILGYRLRPPGPRPASWLRWLACATALRHTTLEGLPIRFGAAISRQLRDDLAEGGFDTSHVEVVYQGIRTVDFPPRGEPGAVGVPMRVLYTGQLNRYKGVHTLVDAVGRFAAARGKDSISVTVAGDGDPAYVAELKNAAAATSAAFRFTGRLPRHELPALYRAHDVFVFPSIWREPFGLTHLEAMCSGLPVVSTADGGQGEFLRDGDNALVFPKEDAGALAERLGRLADGAELARRVAASGRETVLRDFDIERYIGDLERLVARAAGQ
ncbi:MAG: glycosyltransferase family 4 protein [Candidatus Sumerlaeia bacterium]|nr:glycosyltransferase family 4 protein [Candidatus Sumerlaeia bacterium]